MYVSRVPKWLPLLAGCIIASTVLIRIHYLLDIAFGLAVSELTFLLVLRRMERVSAFATMANATARVGELLVVLAAVAGYVILLRV
jgi:membrane-associated phospholipid phosphatase